ncbi:pyridoxamine 5'-phosphate oxidase family protein [Mesorhizobium sp.]|uniref:pyridoxamine 5'-phosphate oxidase family protein n=1 Tax=Mesorhizobium sp. TaxID=1871066 RepID=UPI000FE2D534|nr:pyridoxamine 5'-phosphate oxidase family protein [Mesorhizobium sp.]RWH75873.1 MAG: pyridoxamine 5'-phosphate oxidase family protein [Mesorhizobium sp.]RWL28971.1 MAG: pyridoxamine 5'-phosphate oxidase family protein [Mesorhizobium sp.]RWL30917.1 MAG: pyridoxamine 5'-phosphate oxidase family protein [Mesorhizobium sp.]RWL35337.1 MAG: pyridoxamine 5'-phosphate oxidase family protein [Mesorhizobium sp.]RWL48937.1 MAG: pyridoxamine 5'-phosphate oxidase family protein [Mesorhizobium sp.]
MSRIASVEQLEALYGLPGEASVVKELDHVIPEYAAFIEASPFVVLATSGPEGLDCSPRGDLAGFVRLVDDRTLMMPDRRGNNRADSLKNIIRDPRVGLLFLVPGSGTTLRVNGRAHITTDAELCASFMVDGKPARSVAVIAVDTVYFQCARAIVRSDLWNPAKHVDPKSLPTSGQILEVTSRKNIDGATYDKEWPERAKKTMW